MREDGFRDGRLVCKDLGWCGGKGGRGKRGAGEKGGGGGRNVMGWVGMGGGSGGDFGVKMCGRCWVPGS